jgi:hypothetical protein
MKPQEKTEMANNILEGVAFHVSIVLSVHSFVHQAKGELLVLSFSDESFR